jgi:peptidoglycan/LPS O-acetylase OafA/YrhL
VNGEASLRSFLALGGTVSVVAVIGIWLNYVVLFKPDDRFTFTAVIASWSVAYAFFLAALMLRQRRFPSLLTWLGLISYSLYVLHPCMLAIFESRVAGISGFLIIMASVLAGCTLTYYVIEKPFIKFGKTLSKDARKKAEPTPIAAAASAQ